MLILEAQAQVEANALAQASAEATITIMQFAQGAFSGQMVADGDSYNLSGNASVDQLQDLEVGPVTAKDGHFDATLENGTVTEVAGSGSLIFGETFQGDASASFDPSDSTLTGVAQLSQLAPIGGPVERQLEGFAGGVAAPFAPFGRQIARTGQLTDSERRIATCLVSWFSVQASRSSVRSSGRTASCRASTRAAICETSTRRRSLTTSRTGS